MRRYSALRAVTFDVTLPDGATGTQRAVPNTNASVSPRARAARDIVPSVLVEAAGQRRHEPAPGARSAGRPWVLQRNDLWPRATASAVYVSRRWDSSRPCQNGSAAVASGCVTASTAGEDLPDLQSHSAASNGTYGIGESPFVLIAIHEVPAGGWLVWEEGKYVPVSSRRFKHVETTTLGGGGGGLSVTLAGAPGEVVVLTALQPRGGLGSDAPEWTVHAIRQTVGKAGVVSFLVR